MLWQFQVFCTQCFSLQIQLAQDVSIQLLVSFNQSSKKLFSESIKYQEMNIYYRIHLHFCMFSEHLQEEFLLDFGLFSTKEFMNTQIKLKIKENQLLQIIANFMIIKFMMLKVFNESIRFIILISF